MSRSSRKNYDREDAVSIWGVQHSRNGFGEEHGKLTQIGGCWLNAPDRHWHASYRCDCGKVFTASQNNVRSGHSLSCSKKCAESIDPELLPPDQREHKLRDRHRRMMDRCYNSRDRKYKDYGARGIEVCKRWQIYEYFRDDLVGSIGWPQRSQSLDRIDNDGDYEPGNVRWADPKTQVGNRRNSVKIVLFDETFDVTSVATICGIPEGTLYQRTQKLRRTRADEIASALDDATRRDLERQPANSYGMGQLRLFTETPTEAKFSERVPFVELADRFADSLALTRQREWAAKRQETL